MNNLGFLCDKGQGVPRNYARAHAFYQKAADLGSREAMYSLGLFYENGYGVS